MNYRTLGETGLRVSEIGFGTWGIGGTAGGSVAYGPADDAESLRSLNRALDLGITFYDTADFYGFGHSEELLAAAFGTKRERVVIASKVGFVDVAGRQDFSLPHIRSSLEGSLSRLKTDYIDLYQLHSPGLDVLRGHPEIVALLETFQREGKIRAYGLSLKSIDDGLPAIDEFGFKALQINFNLADQRLAQGGLLDHCVRAGVGVIVRTPLSFGLLTDTHPVSGGFGANDHRKRWSAEQIQVWSDAARLFMHAVSDGGRQTAAQVALRFGLSYPGVSTVIPGMMKVSEVEEDAAASGMGPLTVSERLDIERVYREHDFVVRKK